jgi:hypothetical protein
MLLDASQPPVQSRTLEPVGASAPLPKHSNDQARAPFVREVPPMSSVNLVGDDVTLDEVLHCVGGRFA